MTGGPRPITAVATAVPAFIGYTEVARDDAGADLRLVPTAIGSVSDYERLFGGAQAETRLTVTVEEWTAASGRPVDLTAVATLVEADRTAHVLYYAMETFFANGGGPCYVVSAGGFTATGRPILEDLMSALATLSTISGPTLIVIPEARSLQPISDFMTLQRAALAQCAVLRDRFTIMDAPDGFDATAFTEHAGYGAAYGPPIDTALDLLVDEDAVTVAHTRDGASLETRTLAALRAAGGATYDAARSAIADVPCTVAPSAAVAGVYATVDRTVGVWKAPANVVVKTAIRPAVDVPDTAGSAVNAIRRFPKRGTLVWGARTLAQADFEWRYVSVRRLFTFVEQSVVRGIAPFVFEPNDAATWAGVRDVVGDFLTPLWRSGALQGTTPEDAFFVAAGLGRTMTELDVAEGRMIVEIGMAAARPGEFVILRVMQQR